MSTNNYSTYKVSFQVSEYNVFGISPTSGYMYVRKRVFLHNKEEKKDGRMVSRES